MERKKLLITSWTGAEVKLNERHFFSEIIQQYTVHCTAVSTLSKGS